MVTRATQLTNCELHPVMKETGRVFVFESVLFFGAQMCM